MISVLNFSGKGVNLEPLSVMGTVNAIDQIVEDLPVSKGTYTENNLPEHLQT